jgi:hypothetical protein
MIKSIGKARLPKELSFPFGAQLLSEHLANVPQHDSLEVGFAWLSGMTPKQTIDHVESGKPLRVVTVQYEHERPGRSGSHFREKLGHFDERWSIWVDPVPSSRKAEARKLITQEGFPKIVGWLNKHREPTWCEGRHSCVLYIKFSEFSSIEFRYD